MIALFTGSSAPHIATGWWSKAEGKIEERFSKARRAIDISIARADSGIEHESLVALFSRVSSQYFAVFGRYLHRALFFSRLILCDKDSDYVNVQNIIAIYLCIGWLNVYLSVQCWMDHWYASALHEIIQTWGITEVFRWYWFVDADCYFHFQVSSI